MVMRPSVFDPDLSSFLPRPSLTTGLLSFDGFYATNPHQWEEWHAGVRMHGVRFHYVRYYPCGDWISCYRDHPFDFWAFTEAATPELWALAKRGIAPLIGDGDPSCQAGRFRIEGHTVIHLSKPDMLGGSVHEWRQTIEAQQLVGADGSGAPYVLRFPQQSA